MEYVINGYSKSLNNSCLVYTCGKSKEHAEDVLHRMLSNPTDHDKAVMKGLTDFHIRTVNEEDAWWNYGCD